MSGTFVMMMAAGATVEQPIDGQTGVWLKVGGATISSAMKMTGVVVSSGYTLYVYSRGAASNCATEATGAVINVYAGGYAADADAPTGGVIATRSGGIISGGTARGGGYYVAYSGGILSGIVLSSGGSLFGYGGGVSGATVGSGARLRLQSSGSIADDVIIERAGYLYVSEGCSASAVSVASAANLIISSGGTALAVTSNAGANINVSSGGYIEYVNVGPVDGSAGVFLRSAGITVSSAMSMTEPVIISSGYQLDVYSGGAVLSAEWQRAGTPHVYSGGSVDHMLVSNQSTATEHCYIDLGGRVEDISIVNTNSRYLHGPGSIGSLTLMSGVVFASSASIGTLTQSTYGGLRALEGTTISNALISANHLHISPGAFVSSATVFTGGNMSVYSGGTALNVRNSGGSIVVKDGGYIEYVTP